MNRTVAGSEECNCDCRFPEPTQGATFVCQECGATYWTAVHRTYRQWIWIDDAGSEAT